MSDFASSLSSFTVITFITGLKKGIKSPVILRALFAAVEPS